MKQAEEPRSTQAFLEVGDHAAAGLPPKPICGQSRLFSLLSNPPQSCSRAILRGYCSPRGPLRPKASTNWHPSAKASPSILNGRASEIHVGVSNFCRGARRLERPPLSTAHRHPTGLPPRQAISRGPGKRLVAAVSDVNGSFEQEAATELE